MGDVKANGDVAKVVGWAYRGPRGGLIVTEEKPKHAPEAEAVVYQSEAAPLLQQQEAEIARLGEDRDGALRANEALNSAIDRCRMDASAAEARVKVLESALEHISSPTQTEGLLWWQIAARSALQDGVKE